MRAASWAEGPQPHPDVQGPRLRQEGEDSAGSGSWVLRSTGYPGPSSPHLCAFFPIESRDVSVGTLFWLWAGEGPRPHHWPGKMRTEACPQGTGHPIRVILTRSCGFREVLCCCLPVLCTAPPHIPSESLARPERSEVLRSLRAADRRTCGSGVPAPRVPGTWEQLPRSLPRRKSPCQAECWPSAHLLLPAPQAWGRGSRSDGRACGLRLHSHRVLAAAKWH